MNNDHDQTGRPYQDVDREAEHPAGEIEIRPRSRVGLRATALLGMTSVMSTITITENPIFTFSVR